MIKYVTTEILISCALFLGVLLSTLAGRWLGIRAQARDRKTASSGTGAIDAAIFALLGLLVAFTFSGAASRFDMRRALVVDEANRVGTAYLRLDLLPAEAQPALRELFRRYLDSRLDAYRKLPDLAAAEAELAHATQIQSDIWQQTVRSLQLDGAQPAAPVLLLPALNDMFDITTSRTWAGQMHPPGIIFLMLFGMALTSALLAGYGMGIHVSRGRLHLFAFAAVLAIVVCVIIDIEYPRMGLIRVDAFDQVLSDVRESMD